MAKKIFISCLPDETWRDATQSLHTYLGLHTLELETYLNDGDHLHLENGIFFRSIGIPHQSIHHIELILQWCRDTGRQSGLMINNFFESTLGSFKQDQFRITAQQVPPSRTTT